jgi:hypothetical protein
MPVGATFSAPAQTVVGPPSLPYSWYRVSFPGVKRSGRRVDHPLPHLEPRLKKGYSYISTRILGLRGMLQDEFYCYLFLQWTAQAVMSTRTVAYQLHLSDTVKIGTPIPHFKIPTPNTNPSNVIICHSRGNYGWCKEISQHLTYLLTPWSRVLLEKLTGFAASQEIPRIYGTRRFITAFTSARHLSLSWAKSIQSMPPHISLPEDPY